MGYSSLMLDDSDDEAQYIESLIKKKHQDYVRRASLYRMLYYATRLGTGLSAGVLPFVVQSSPSAATVLSLLIVVLTVFDAVFAPKDNWTLFSQASDHLTLSRLKIHGQYERYKEALTILMETEARALKSLISLDVLLEEARSSREKPEGKSPTTS